MHSLAEGELLLAGVENSGRVFASGTQQRSWDHYLLAKQTIDSGLLGQITLAQCYWYQNRIARQDQGFDAARLDWKKWIGSAPDQPFDPLRFNRWRYFWDFGGGIFADLMTHRIDIIQWVMKSPAPSLVQVCGAKYAVAWIECPDTVTATFQFPNNYTAIYYGTMVGSLEGGGIIFRGTEAMMKLTRDSFAIYREGTIPQEFTGLPDSGGSRAEQGRRHADESGELARLHPLPRPAQLACTRRGGGGAHLANQAMRQGEAIS